MGNRPVTQPRVSLTEYAATNPAPVSGPIAWLPNLPEWPAIRTAWETGTVTGTQIRDWLINECGYPADMVTYARVGGYLSKNHPRRTNG